jgi:glycogen operon protein
MMRRISEGAPEPLGVMLDAEGVNVAVFSAHAEAIEFCLFDERGDVELERFRLPFRTGNVFHAHIGDLNEGARYGLRAHGPFDPHRGHRFNAAKLLVDPYAVALDRPFSLHASMFAFAEDDPSHDLSIDSTDSAPFTPKGIVSRIPSAKTNSRQRIQWRDTIIYELHVRGFTKLHPGVPEELRGTFAGLAHDAAIAYLARLGVTTIELMPCAAWVDEPHLATIGLTNYWGYNPIAMMAPDPRLAPGGWAEVSAAVARLHDAGFEVIVDVVLNHSGEGDALGPTLSLRGLDNATYYRLPAEDKRRYVNDSGCGNVLALDRAPVLRYAMDALRAWVDYGGVDGFRFDLATALARGESGFSADAPMLAAIAQDPDLRELKLIAEPWDIGPGGYQLGSFPALWGEWNDRFRDAARRFWRGDDIGVSELTTRVAGSSDLFPRHGRPSRSINFITAHDGFTLADLVSYEQKHNEANGEGNRDGTNENFSWNNGVEGETSDLDILASRKRDQRNLLATLVLARGTPMLSMGMELAHSQHGDNNAYAQDNGLAWINWDKADESLVEFAAQLIALRKAHGAVRQDLFLSGEPGDASLIPDVEWLRFDGAPMQDADWRDGRAATLIASLYASDEADRVMVIYHRGAEDVVVTPPQARPAYHWVACLDTSLNDGALPAQEESGAFRIAARSIAILCEARSHGRRRESAIPDDMLRTLTQAAGVSMQWWDIEGGVHNVPPETYQSLLKALGLCARTLTEGRESLARLSERIDRRLLPESKLIREDEDLVLRIAMNKGRTPLGLVIAREDGSQERIRLTANAPQDVRWRGVDGRMSRGVMARLPRQPLGRHRIMIENADNSVCRLTIAPCRCYLPREALEQGAFGLSAQLYSLRRGGDQGVGDFTTLAQLSEAAAARGATLIAINPLHALFSQNRERASPYYPSDRRFLDPIYIDLLACRDVVDETAWSCALAAEQASIDALAYATDVDYPRVSGVKRRVLERLFVAFDDFAHRRPEQASVAAFNRFIEAGGEALWRFACFETISEIRMGEDWRVWPIELREGQGAALQAIARECLRRLRFHSFLQWLCDRQFRDAASRASSAGLHLGFCRDLAVGSAPDGAECWSNRDRFIDGFSIGAPPDPFSRDGQVWGLAPPNPLAWRDDGCAAFSELISANMRHAGALRIDHVMGFARLFLVPDGARAAQGAYLSYPFDDLLGQMALESARAKCFVVGEDLGTVPSGLREKLDGANVLRYRVLWFEREGQAFAAPSHYSRKAMACVSTHDLPTLAGWWAGEDIAEKTLLGLLSQDDAQLAKSARATDKRELLAALRAEDLIDDAKHPAAPFDDELAGAIHAFIARTPCWLAMAQVEDLAGETVAVNLPGTDRERANWRRKIADELAQTLESTRSRAILACLRRNLDQIPATNPSPSQTPTASCE